MIAAELAALVEGNAWTFGPVATALRILRMTRRANLDPSAAWEPLLAECPRMAPLGYWLAAVRDGWTLDRLEEDCLRRESLLLRHLSARLGTARTVLVAGHDRELDILFDVDPGPREYRYLLLDGPAAVDAPGAYSRRRLRTTRARLGPPFDFHRLEEGLDWADAVLLTGFIVHRQNVLGPSQLRPLLASARDQVDEVLLCALNERRVTLGEGSPRLYRDDFRPYLWQSSVTHLVSEWHSGAEGTALGWLPLPPDTLSLRFGEELFPR